MPEMVNISQMNGKGSLYMLNKISQFFDLFSVQTQAITNKALVSATRLNGAQSARSLRLSASGAQILRGQR